MTNSIHILLEYQMFNTNPSFKKFIDAFKEGRYYHYRCQGFMESLVLTKCYSPFSINYWIYQLVYPAAQHFSEALENLDKMKQSSPLNQNKEFEQLLVTVEEFKKTSDEIMRLVRTYNIKY